MSDEKGNIFTRIKRFFKNAFKDMGESAKTQHEVDKANFKAAKAEARANFEESRATNTFKKAKADAKSNWDDARMSPGERVEKIKQEQQKQLEAANKREEEANDRYKAAKVNNKND